VLVLSGAVLVIVIDLSTTLSAPPATSAISSLSVGLAFVLVLSGAVLVIVIDLSTTLSAPPATSAISSLSDDADPQFVNYTGSGEQVDDRLDLLTVFRRKINPSKC
jgi:hypothetical protein